MQTVDIYLFPFYYHFHSSLISIFTRLYFWKGKINLIVWKSVLLLYNAIWPGSYPLSTYATFSEN